VGQSCNAGACQCGGGIAWAWSSDWGVPAAYSYNSQGSTNTVTRLATGYYRVDFPGMNPSACGGNSGNAQVVAHSGTNERCKVESWGANAFTPTTISVHVRCVTPSGAPANSPFVANFRRHVATSTQGIAGGYLWADQPTAASYTPSSAYQWKPAGTAHTIRRHSVGTYEVTIAGSSTSGGTVAVTAQGPGSEHCKVSWWSVIGANTVVGVNCFSTTGSPVDTRFSLNFDYGTPSGTTDYGYLMPFKGGYAWTNDPNAASYTPLWPYQTILDRLSYPQGCVAMRSVTAGRTATGRYFLDYGLLRDTDSTAFATAHGVGSNYCKLQSWLSDGSGGTRVSVKCFDASGAPADSAYVGQYMLSTPAVAIPCL
jgi:hypothetical protein